jgi:hypothetical protein
LPRRHLVELDVKVVELEAAHIALAAIYDRTGALGPVDCTDPYRCQILTDSMPTG